MIRVIFCLLAFVFAISGNVWSQNKIKSAEYFIDTDPGIGKAKKISFTSATDISHLQISIDTTGLKPGIHHLVVRAKDTSGVWGLNQVWVFLRPFASKDSIFAKPNITYAEYFLGTDPGFGKATAISFTPGTDISDLLISLDTTGLKAGIQTLIVRAKDANGNWSLSQDWLFLRPFASKDTIYARPNVTYAEYFLDTDPGLGKATAISFTPGTDISDLLISLDTTGLKPGIHNLRVRAKDGNGNWSLSQDWLFFRPFASKDTVFPKPNITYAEYFLDTDPGFGKATAISFTAGIDVSNLLVSLDTAGMKGGLHNLKVRAKDANGNWSLNQNWLFLKPLPSSVAPVAGKITYAEYFLGNDPGYGQATSISLTPGTDISNLLIQLDTSSLSTGINNIAVRAKDEFGKWSLNQVFLFYKYTIQKDSIKSVSKITYVEYYVDNDPGLGKGTPVTITPSTDINNLAIPLDITGWEVGNYNFYLRARDSLGNWSLVNKWSFRIEVPSGYVITVGKIEDTVCAGGPVLVPFTVNSPFGTTNVFTAQLSDANGSFSNPINIGSLSGRNSDTIKATIPDYITAGNNFHIRVLASTPYDTSAVNNDAVSIRKAPSQFILIGKTSVCKALENYRPNFTESGVSYKWNLSGGGTITTSGTNGSRADITWTTGGTYSVKLSSFNYCGVKTDSLSVQVVDTPLTGVFTNMLPSDSNRNLSFPITFSWFPINNATSYDLYIWPSDQTRPSSPYISNITDINYTLYGGLQYEKYYKWQIVAKRLCYTLESPVQTFQLRYLPDLVVNSIQVPSSAHSGKNISVSWEIKNTGQGSTLNQQWFDRVYLSKDAILDNTDILLGSVSNQSALDPNKSYSQTASFQLPQGINDNYYIFIQTNPYNQVQENNSNNNSSVSTSTVFVQLTPPPDLQVTSIVTPNFGFSNQDLEVSWKVTNTGTGGTVATQWYDYLYLTKDSVLNFSKATFIGNFFRDGALNAGENYNQKQTIHIPDGFFGKYYVFVTTDVYNYVYEHASENNNTSRSDSITVKLTPPINLVVNEVTIPSSGSNRENVTIKWKVENAGGSSTAGKAWTDNIYLSKASTFKRDSIQYLGGLSHYSTLESGDMYEAETTVTIPDKIAGNYYIYIKTDADSVVFEHTFENDNIMRAASPISILSADLIVSSINIPSKDSSGKVIEVKYGVKNNGPGRLINATIKDRVLLSTSAAYDPLNVSELTTVTYSTGDISAGDTIARTASVKLPNGISGNYYIYVQTDFSNAVFENTNENNNIRRSASQLNIVLSPWADLQVSNIQTPDSATAGDVISLSFKVSNKGSAPVTDTLWTDNIYFSKNSTFDPAGSIFIREAVRTSALGKDSAYRVLTTAKVPGNIDEGDYYVYVFTDAKNNIYEHTDEANNITRKGFLYIKKYPPVDLAVTSVSAPKNGNSGKPIAVSYDVENKGIAPTLQAQWNDALYLSKDTVWDKNNDLLVKNVIHKGVLPAGASYSNTENFVLPNGISGKYYLLLVTDPDDVNYDVNRKNNYRLITSGNDSATINITLTPPSDLIVTSLKVPDNGTAGQPVSITWKIKNTGAGATAVKSWTDKIYLSANLTLDGSDAVLGSSIRNDSLMPGEEYADTLQVFLPNSVSGNYVVILKTDANDNVYEHQNENNNTAYSLMTIVKPPLSDIVVTDITVPATEVMAGDPVKIEWKVKNIGANPASGYMKQGVYLSLDSIKDVTDVLLYSPDTHINLAPQDEIKDSLTQEIKGVSLKDYHVIIHTDVLNNILESNDTNNISYSREKLKVTVPELKINVTATRTLTSNKEVYYRIEIPDSLIGESLLVTLKGDSVNGRNEIYLRYAEVPTRVVYDYTHSQPYEGNQEVIIPELKKGTYYLMVFGSTSAGSSQQISLLAKILNFEIRSVNAKEGGNTGTVTVLIQGSKLGTVNRARLTANGQNIIADSIKVIDPTKIFATFNLKGAALGNYDAVVENVKGEIATLPKGFTVVTGLAPNLVTNVTTPPNTRLSNVISITVLYTNAGNTDIIKPVLKLSSLGGAPIAFNVSELANNTKELTLSLQEVNGPSGILRPGASGTIIVYAKATTALSFMLLQSK